MVQENLASVLENLQDTIENEIKMIDLPCTNNKLNDLTVTTLRDMAVERNLINKTNARKLKKQEIIDLLS